MIFKYLIYSTTLFSAALGGTIQFRVSSHNRARALEPLPAMPSPSLQFGAMIVKSSPALPKRLTVNVTDVRDLHRHKLERRADECDPTTEEQECRRPPLFPMPSCYWCPEPADLAGDPVGLLSQFTTEEFRTRTRATPADLVDTCMFYSKTAFQPPRALSRVATQLACQYGKYSIWHLWSNKANEEEDNRLLDYYGIFDPSNRLYPISQMGTIDGSGPPEKDWYRIYFEHMSEAMAQMCTGQIYVLSQTPRDLAQYGVPPLQPNIWNDKELVTLRRHLQELGDSLIAIDSTKLPDVVAWRINWRTLDVEGSVTFPTEIWEPFNMTLEYGPWTERRASLCANSGVDSEPDGYDFFG
ncbi:hypothetical protein F4811DRAFT_438311 [Daldinia bambusicola]|nr:hypothetical protein F4811DRAFT_438311 [Daldinia bambusicola]